MINNKMLPDKKGLMFFKLNIKHSFSYALLIFSLSFFVTMNYTHAAIVESNAVTTNGQPSAAHFSISAIADNGSYNAAIFNSLHKIDILGKLDIPPEQVGKNAAIYVVAKYQDNWYMKASDGSWLSWDFNLSNLVPYITKLTLSATQQGLIQNQLTGLVGNFQVYAGYKIDNELFYNTNPLTFTVTDMTATQVIQMLEEQGKIPILDRSTGIKGPDANTNGIRDDVDAYIQTLPITQEQKIATSQLAKAVQNTLLVDLTNSTALRQVDTYMTRAFQCVSLKFPNDSERTAIVNEMEKMTANTKERAMQYIAYNNALSGTVTKLLTENTCEN